MLMLKSHKAPVRCLAYSPDGRFLASGGEDPATVIWDIAKGKPAVTQKEDASVEAVAFTPDGKGLVVGLAGGDVVFRNGKRWDEKTRHEEVHGQGVRSVAFATDGRLATAGWDGTIALFPPDLESHDTLYEGEHPIWGLSFLADGKRLAAGTYNGEVLLFDLPRKKPKTTLSADRQVHALACSPDGERLAAAGNVGDEGGDILLWDLAKPARPRTLKGHTWIVYGLGFTPDGTSLVSGGADHTVRVWDVKSGRERKCYRWFTSWVTSLAVAPDGLTVAAGSNDHSIVIFDLEPG